MDVYMAAIGGQHCVRLSSAESKGDVTGTGGGYEPKRVVADGNPCVYIYILQSRSVRFSRSCQVNSDIYFRPICSAMAGDNLGNFQSGSGLETNPYWNPSAHHQHLV